MDQNTNPYAPPKYDEAPSGPRPSGVAATQLEAIRREHINAETNVKTLGFLLYLGAFGLILGGLAQLTNDPLVGALNLALGAALGVSGYWLRRFDRRGRLVYTIFVALAIVAAFAAGKPAGSAAYQLGRLFWPLLFLAVLWSSKATTVMTPHYRDVVIPATPHVKRETSVVLIVLLVLLVLMVAAVIVANVIG